MRNVFYFRSLNSIGGVESWLYYLAKQYKNMVVYYSEGDSKQVERLGALVETRRFKKERIKCDRFFCAFKPDIIDYVDAKEYIQVIHANYKKRGMMPCYDPKITKYIGVSEVCCEDFRELTGLDIECIYNPVYIDKPKKVLKLVSATRLTPEKGKDRMAKLGRILNESGIPYLWLIFTNSGDTICNQNMIFMPPQLDISGYIVDADWFVQLSDDESFGLAPCEAAMLGVPCILTDLPVFKEIGFDDSNSIRLDMNLSNVDVGKIYKGLGKIKFTPPKSNWGKYLDNDCDYNANEEVTLKSLILFDDIETGERHVKDSIFTRPRSRANVLLDLGYVEDVDLESGK